MRVLSLDVGDKTVGVAVSDPTGVIATPVVTIKRGKSVDRDIEEIVSLANAYKVCEVVVGLPISLGNRQTAQTQKVTEFTERLKESIQVPVVYYDERYTTKIAHSVLYEAGIKGRHHKKVVDQLSAVIILEDFLESRRNQN